MGVQTLVDDLQCFLHDWAQGICAIRSKRINLIGYCFAIHFFAMNRAYWSWWARYERKRGKLEANASF